MAHDSSQQYSWGAAVTALSVNAAGSSAVLAARRKLFVLDLDQVQEPERVLSHQSRWDVGVLQCCPDPHYSNFVAFTCNQNTLIWNLEAEHSPHHATLQMHTRAVNDVSWSPFSPHLLASCSSDTYVHLWDVRQPKKASCSFCAWTAGATQVVWSRFQEHCIASAHEGEIRVWDRRKGTSPAVQILAHSQSILALDWSWTQGSQLLSGSLDRSVKLWDLNHPNDSLMEFETNGPVCKAQFVPYSSAVLLTQAGTTSSCDLQLWSLEEQEARLAHSYRGHTGEIVDFSWVRPEPRARKLQFASWSKDTSLRVWPVPNSVRSMAGSGDRGVDQQSGEREPAMPEGRPPEALRVEIHQLLAEYGHFVMLLSENLANHEWFLRIDTDFDDFVTLRVRYPTACKDDPLLTLDVPGGMIDDVLHQVKEKYAGSRELLAECVQAIHTVHTHAMLTSATEMPSFEDFNHFEGMAGLSAGSEESLDAVFLPQNNGQVMPCPRTSAASFSSTGELVRFSNFPERRSNSSTEHPANIMPRTYEHLKAWVQERYQSPMFGPDCASDIFARSVFFPQEHDESPFGISDMSSQVLSTTVTVVNPEHGLVLRNRLAGTYRLPGPESVGWVCHHNEKQALLVGRPDLVQLWKAVAIVSDQVGSEVGNLGGSRTRWLHHPFGASLMGRFIEHYIRCRDLQTLAVLTTVLSAVESAPGLVLSKFDGAADWWRYEYGSVLHRLGMYQEHAEIHKFMKDSDLHPPALKMWQCHDKANQCHDESSHAERMGCDHSTSEGSCIVCRMPIHGVSSMCGVCGHVGHLEHIMKWFAEEDHCPHPGCGCSCRALS